MKKLFIKTSERDYNIKIGCDILRTLPDEIYRFSSCKKILIVSNKKVYHLYGKEIFDDLLSSGFIVDVILLKDGEKYKSADSFFRIQKLLINNNYSRDDVLLTLGGGVIGDVGGFAAATFKRGMHFVYVPTTLLSQIDSSVGGKTAINYGQNKNVIGTFYQPSLVIIDPNVLITLKQKDYLSGIAELIKMALILDDKLYEDVDVLADKILDRDIDIMTELIYQSCRLKAKVIEQDEHDRSYRNILNFGHTFAHAIEEMTRYRKYTHGQAVFIGINLAVLLSEKLTYLRLETAEKIRRLLTKYGVDNLVNVKIDYSKMLKFFYKDKKSNGNDIYFVLISDLGKVVSIDGNYKVKVEPEILEELLLYR